VRRGEWNQAGKSKTAPGRLIKGVRWSLLKAPERQNTWQLAALHEVSKTNRRLYRAFLLKEQLRCSTTCPTPPPHPPTSTPGWPGLRAASSSPSSSSRAACARAATASSPQSASAYPTVAWKASTARSACSLTAPLDSTAPNR